MTAKEHLCEWVFRGTDDNRYFLYAEIIMSIPSNSWFWGSYNDLYLAVDPRKRSLTHYLFMGAVQFRVLRSPKSDLSKFFPISLSYCEDVDHGNVADSFLRFCEDHWESLSEIVQNREVQINKLGRNSLILPLLAEANSRLGRAATFVEAGSSVGLGLLWPYLSAGYSSGTALKGGGYTGEVSLECCVAGGPVLPLDGLVDQPERLIGIDIDPLDADCKADVDWLRALVAPNDSAGRKSLECGLALLRRHRPEILRGCVLERLRDIVAAMPDREPLVVYHCMTLHHLIDAGKLEAWRRLLCLIAESRPVIEAYVAWEEGTPSATPWPVEIRIREWRHPISELIGWADPSADGTSIMFRA